MPIEEEGQQGCVDCGEVLGPEEGSGDEGDHCPSCGKFLHKCRARKSWSEKRHWHLVRVSPRKYRIEVNDGSRCAAYLVEIPKDWCVEDRETLIKNLVEALEIRSAVSGIIARKS